MNTVKMPGFTAEKSLARSQRPDAHAADRSRPSGASVIANRGDAGVITPAESVPGGPSTVPSGYDRACQRVPVTVCAGNRCWIEYGWVCTYTPIARAF